MFCPMATRANLIASIEAFCIRHAISEARFGVLACNDAKLCRRIRFGSVTLARIEAIEAFIAAHSLAAPRSRRPAVAVEAAADG